MKLIVCCSIFAFAACVDRSLALQGESIEPDRAANVGTTTASPCGAVEALELANDVDSSVYQFAITDDAVIYPGVTIGEHFIETVHPDGTAPMKLTLLPSISQFITADGGHVFFTDHDGPDGGDNVFDLDVAHNALRVFSSVGKAMHSPIATDDSFVLLGEESIVREDRRASTIRVLPLPSPSGGLGAGVVGRDVLYTAKDRSLMAYGLDDDSFATLLPSSADVSFIAGRSGEVLVGGKSAADNATHLTAITSDGALHDAGALPVGDRFFAFDANTIYSTSGNGTIHWISRSTAAVCSYTLPGNESITSMAVGSGTLYVIAAIVPVNDVFEDGKLWRLTE